MNILIIQGPNFNLIGLKSAKRGKRITLDKINTGIRRHIRNKDITVKIYQTHDISKAITLLQRNRNWADGIIISPGVWGSYEAILVDTIELIEIPTIEVYDEEDNPRYPENSILSDVCKKKFVSLAEDMFVKAINKLYK